MPDRAAHHLAEAERWLRAATEGTSRPSRLAIMTAGDKAAIASAHALVGLLAEDVGGDD